MAFCCKMQWSEGTTQAAGPFTESADSPKYVVVKLFGVFWMQSIIKNDQQNTTTILNPNNQQLFNVSNFKRGENRWH